MKLNYILLTITNLLTLASQQITTGQLPPPPLLINGNRFIKPSDQTPYFFKGIVIQHMFVEDIDPLAKSNLKQCETTARKLKEMGANSALVYRIDHNESHKECMKILNDNNIQVMIGLSPEFSQYNSTYSPQILQNITRTIDEFIHYPNTLGYLAWIENNQSFSDDYSHQLQFIIKKSIMRDVRNYIRKKYQPKVLPLLGANMVYYKDKDVTKVQEYLMCGDRDSQPDFLAVGTFSHCHELEQGDLNALLPKNPTIPMIFSELGCAEADRGFETWKQIATDKRVSEVVSGGFAYELYGTGGKSYGLIPVSGSPPNSTFADNLTNTWNSINPKLSVNKVQRATYQCPSNFPINILDSNNQEGLMRLPSLDVCNCVISHSPCISNLDDPQKLSNQLTTLCNNDSSKCEQYLAPISGNFSQCNMMTRISLLASLKYKDGQSCPPDMIQNPAYNQKNITKYFSSALQCETLWTIKLPLLTYSGGDFFGSNQTNNPSLNSKSSSLSHSIYLPSTTILSTLLLILYTFTTIF